MTKESIKAECDGLPRKDLMYLLDIGNDRIIELYKEISYLTDRRDHIREKLSEIKTEES